MYVRRECLIINCKFVGLYWVFSDFFKLEQNRGLISFTFKNIYPKSVPLFTSENFSILNTFLSNFVINLRISPSVSTLEIVFDKLDIQFWSKLYRKTSLTNWTDKFCQLKPSKTLPICFNLKHRSLTNWT